MPHKKKRNSNTNGYFDVKFGTDVTNSTTNLWKKKISVSKIPGSLNLKFTFQFDHSSTISSEHRHFFTKNKNVWVIDR